MGNIYLYGLVFIIVVSFVLSLLAFFGKNIILDDVYIKASKEERDTMDKKAYRLQSAIIFLLIGIMTLCNVLRGLTDVVWFTYLALIIAVGAVVYAIVSHYTIKNKNKAEADVLVVPASAKSEFNIHNIPPMEKPADFCGDATWSEEIKVLEIEELYARYIDSDGEWTDEYRYLCYEELMARQ